MATMHDRERRIKSSFSSSNKRISCEIFAHFSQIW